MNEDVALRVGPITVCYSVETVGPELLSVFRDEMFRHRPSGNRQPKSGSGQATLKALELLAPGEQVADRLDVMGINAHVILADLDELLQSEAAGLFDEVWLTEFSAEERESLRTEGLLLKSMTGRDWVKGLASTADDADGYFGKSPGSQGWLLKLISDWEARRRLRAVLLALPDADVVLDLSFDPEDPWLEAAPETAASTSQERIRKTASTYVPVVILTEGKTDAEFLRAGLELLYPHLTDLIRFLDYEQRPEGSVSALVRNLKAFAAAGIANRVLAVCDNDTAAADELRKLAEVNLPDHICIMQYPDLELAQHYPTLGPPNIANQHGSSDIADVNGLAGSIELYLGRDVLTDEEETLRPIQWRAFIPGMNRYQGEVTGKSAIHESFRAKVSIAKNRPEAIETQDWEGLRLILDAMLTQLGVRLA